MDLARTSGINEGDSRKTIRKGKKVNTNQAVRLLAAAGGLMLLAGGIFGIMGHWRYAALIWAGAICCAAAALNFRKHKDQ